MKLNTNTTKVETSGIADTTNFSIKVTGKAFKILLDGLYSNKPRAVIREVCTNAYDAHLAIGVGDKPFQVQLPTLWEPVFRVRDFGVSMTHEQIMRLFTTVFDSTKDDANNQVGAFGLGSKSPFCLTDNYQITVWKDGKKRVYSAYFGPDGIPALSLLATQDSDEPAGVEVSLTIAQKDVDAFETEAKKVLRWFPTTPEFVGKKHVTIDKPKPLVSGNGWVLLADNSRPSDSYRSSYAVGPKEPTAYARQGCVVYPIDAASLHNLTKEQRGVLQGNVVIDFPIGTLDVAASREALAYEDVTCNNIIARVNSVIDELQEIYGREIREAKTRWEAAQKRIKFRDTSGLHESLVDAICSTKWNNEEPMEWLDMRDTIDSLRKAGLEFDAYAWDAWRVRRNNVSVPLDIHAEGEAKESRLRLGDDESAKFFFSVKEETVTYEGRRLRTEIAAFSPRVSFLFVVKNEADIQTIMDALGSPPTKTMTRDLPAPVVNTSSTPRKTTGKTKREQIKVREITFDAAGANPKEGDEKVIDLDGDAYYVLTRGSAVVDLIAGAEKDLPKHAVLDSLVAALELKWFTRTKPLYAISTTYQKRVEEFGKWQKIADAIKDTAASSDPVTVLYQEAETREVDKLLAGNKWLTMLRQKHILDFSTNNTGTPIGQLKELLDKYSISNTLNKYPSYNYNDKLNKLVYRCRIFGVDHFSASRKAEAKLRDSVKIKEFQNAFAACEKDYPLLRGWDNYKLTGNTTSEWEAILQYIKALNVLQQEAIKNTQQKDLKIAA